MRILYLAAEVAPFSKVGGLADVAGGLPPALARLRHDVRIVTPLYRSVERSQLERVGSVSPILGGRPQPVTLHAIETTRAGDGRVVVYFCEHQDFDRSDVYGGADEPHRFAVLARAALGVGDAVAFAPRILHANDWHTALAVAELDAGRAAHPALAEARSVLTIHNLAFQGAVDDQYLAWLGPPATRVFVPARHRNLLGWGIASADLVTTVSPTYAREITTPRMGMGLEPVLQSLRRGVIGITNGIDTDAYDPARDEALAAPFDVHQQVGREACRLALRQQAGLASTPDQPILGMVARLFLQKGVDLVCDAAAELVGMGASLVVLGTGERDLAARLVDVARAFPGRVAVRTGFDAAFARRIYAGSDMFLIPSRFEPCGLGQLIAMRYGSVPIGRRTGGLADTITDAVTGFLFDEPTPAGLVGGVDRAMTVWRDSHRWAQLRTRCMQMDNSWAMSAVAYQDAYAVATASANNGAAAPS